jgi:hypothetical protein
MLAGSHPYGRRGADLALQQGLEPAPIESLDSEPRHALLAALDLKRAARPAMAELVRALHGKAEAPAAVVPAAADAAIPVAAVPTAASGIGQSRLAIGSAIVAGLALVLGILIGRQDAGPEREVAKTQPTQRAVAVPPAPEPAPVAIVAAKAMAPDPEEANAEPPDPAAGLPSLVSFDAAAMTVSGRAVVAAIPLRHLSRVRRAVDVHWRLLDGSARAGQDYGGPTTGVESFIEGHSFRILYVPILAATPPTRDRSFAVELTEVSGGASLGPTERIEVTILGSY